MSSAPDYYKILDISPTATAQQVRDGYKRAALKYHPDRVPSDSPERAERTRKFQAVNDAYYTLSDPTRRRDYDSVRAFHSNTRSGASYSAPSFDDDEDFTAGPSTSTGGSGFKWNPFNFGKGADSPSSDPHAEARFADAQFGSAFEEMLREEGLAEDASAEQGSRARPTGKFWSLVGGLSGGAMGFIVANFPGMLAGAVAGNRLGAVRDAKGKSVYQVFQELPQADKAKLLSELAAKIFAQVVSA